MSFKIFNTNVEENEKINDANTKLGQLFGGFMMLQGAVTELQNASGGNGAKNVEVFNGIGGADLETFDNNTIFYSLNQSPGQMLVDSNASYSPVVGTEYVVYTGDNNTVLLQTLKTGGRIQISGTATNTGNVDVTLALNSKCTLTKITQTLWIVQGNGLSYVV